MTAGIEEHLDDVFMQFDKEMKHRMDALEKKRKIRIGPLTEEYVHYCEPEHGTIFEDDGVEERLDKSIKDSQKNSDQQNGVLIKELIEDNMKMKEEKEMCKKISTWKNNNYILMKEKVEQSPWTVMKSK